MLLAQLTFVVSMRMGLPHFYLSNETFQYDFDPKHPLRPERMRRTLALLERFHPTQVVDPGYATGTDLARVHDPEFIASVQELSEARERGELTSNFKAQVGKFGLYGDTPVFPGMWKASLGYVQASIAAARAVRDGASLAFGMGGGLHHAHVGRASGFCVFNDPALAISVLRERFQRVAYVDIDVHHGDGTQEIFLNDPHVLTYSIHESGKTLFPGTGFLHETGSFGTSCNVPIPARTTGDVWLEAFAQTFLPTIEKYRPEAIVLQLGVDTHRMDPLGHIWSDVQTWLAAVKIVRDLRLPIVALGGGGYNLNTVPRMWVAACLSLARLPIPDEIPLDLAEAWGAYTLLDAPPEVMGKNENEVMAVVAAYRDRVLSQVPSG
jgi:acetoin utilization protein AcuC